MPPVGPHLLTCFQSAPCFSSLSQHSQVGIRPRYPDRRDPISLNNPGSQGRDQEGERGSQHRAALPIMRAQGGGQIANTASGIAYVPMPYQSMYSATKAALLGLTTSLRYELWDENIRLSTIIPGTVATSIWAGGPIPDFAITPDESARGILKGLAANERVIFVTDMDREGAINSTDPRAAEGIDKYLLDVARKRRTGTGLF